MLAENLTERSQPMTEPAARPRRARRTDPPKDRNATAMPDATLLSNLANIIRIVEILLTYGRHLAETFDRRAAAPGFHLIARQFGTDRAAVILAHIRRGILRAAALHHVLMQRAARGRDLVRSNPPVRLRPEPAQPAQDTAGIAAPSPAIPAQRTEPQSKKRRRPAHPSWHDPWLDNAANPLDPALLPTFQELVKKAAHRPVGRSLGEIFADLGIAPILSQSNFWNDLFFAMLHFGGTPGYYFLHRWRREQQFEDAQDRCPTMDQTWPPLDVSGARTDTIKALGFFIGEPPMEPLIIMAPEPPPWASHPSPAPNPQTDQAAPPETTGPP